MKKLVNCWGDRPQIPEKSVLFVRDQSQSLPGLSVPRPSVAKSVLLSASESALPRHIDGCYVRLRFDVKGHWHWHQCQPYLIILDVTTVLSVKGILSHSIDKSCWIFGPILSWERHWLIIIIIMVMACTALERNATSSIVVTVFDVQSWRDVLKWIST